MLMRVNAAMRRYVNAAMRQRGDASTRRCGRNAKQVQASRLRYVNIRRQARS
jgi:hypothetical protein